MERVVQFRRRCAAARAPGATTTLSARRLETTPRADAGSVDARDDEPTELWRSAIALHARVLAFDVSLDDASPRDALAADVVEPLGVLLQHVRVLLAHAQRLDPSETGDGLTVDEPSSLVRSTSLVDASFLGELDLAQRAARLARATRGPAVRVLAEAADALHAAAQVLAELEGALARRIGEPAAIHRASTLEEALLTRRTVARARALARPAEAPAANELPRRLRLAAVAVASLASWPATPTLALEDRVAVLVLQRALTAWLAAPADDEAPRLWASVCALLDDLDRTQVRRDVLAHDAALVARALQVVGDDASDVPGSTLERLERIEGVSPSVDALLASPWRTLASAWRPLLVRLGDRLGPS